ncbi:hypothetical protein BD779DRAFT_1807135 [Infundibulicybe gibba]|nr:hypothetical protein BD779DRAFT_1807135 [Infundibulicybe gibba]
MHRCLLIPEILRIICVHASAHHRHRDLQAVALVCRSFYNASLDLLWRGIRGLLPLAKSLPSDMWDRPLNCSNNAVLTRAITPSDLERFRAHSRHIQSYHNYINAPVSIYQALSFHFHEGQPIFPNLEAMTWGYCKTEIFPYISMFLGPRIRKLDLCINGDSVQNSLLPTLGVKCPSLVYFRLYTLDYYPEVKPLLTQWSQLETLIIHYLPEESLQIAAGLPHLRNLTLSHADDDYGSTFSPTPGTKVFPSLQSLSITANSPTLCINLLKATSNCQLKEFEFSLFGIDPPIWDDLFATLAESCDKDTLTTIRIDDLELECDESWDPRTMDELRLLFPFTSLTHVILRTTHGFDIDDAFMSEIAVAWPRIRTLNIGATGITQLFKLQQLTLHGLAPLAELCPELRKLTVHVNVAHMCPNYFNLCSDSKSCIKYLNFGRSPISKTSVPWAAVYLSAIFPELRDVDCDHDSYRDEEEPDYPARWSEVHNYLVACHYLSGHRRNGPYCDCESDTI